MHSADPPLFRDGTCFSSPKRKRDSDEIEDASPGALRSRTAVPTRPHEHDLRQGTSLGMTVTGQLQALDLQDSSSVPHIQSQMSTERLTDLATACFQLGFSHVDNASSHNCEDSQPDAAESHQETDAELRSRCTAPEQRVHTAQPSSNTEQTRRLSAGRLVGDQNIPPLATLRRCRSPPALYVVPRSVSWPEPATTEHERQDFFDDGYGLNGIGFRPTPAMAHARVQRRKQQVAEWKSREAKEARQKRIDQRRLREGNFEGGKEVRNEEPRRVRFQPDG